MFVVAAVSSFLEAWPAILVASFTRYTLVALATFFIICVWLAPRLAKRRIQQRRPERRDIQREIGYSLLTVMIFSATGAMILLGSQSGVFSIHTDLSAYGWGWGWGRVILSAALIVVVHDGYFYWTHRLMHARRLFPLFHRTHHRSLAPTPWAAYAFAPAEAVVQALYLPLFLLFAPVHLGVIIFFIWHMIVRNAIGHSGYEIFPRDWASQRWLGLITPVTHHELHHEKGGGNFGLYFTWWDRLMGTEHAEYHARFDQVTAGGTAADVPAAEF